MKILDIPQFDFQELESALKGTANPRGADEDGVIIEMIKYVAKLFIDILLYVYIVIIIRIIIIRNVQVHENV